MGFSRAAARPEMSCSALLLTCDETVNGEGVAVLARSNIVGRSVVMYVRSNCTHFLLTLTRPHLICFISHNTYITDAHALQVSVLALLHGMAGAARGVFVHK